MITIQQANELLEKYIQNPNLRKHCYAVESCMRFYARQLDQDEEVWGIAGLLHDIDWELNPDTHPISAVPILRDAGVSEEVIDSILGHAYPARSNVKRETLMARYLFACDELSGCIVAYALMKPDKLMGVTPEGVAKKLKDKAFAKNICRDDIHLALDEINMDIITHARNLILAMREDKRLGLS